MSLSPDLAGKLTRLLDAIVNDASPQVKALRLEDLKEELRSNAG